MWCQVSADFSDVRDLEAGFDAHASFRELPDIGSPLPAQGKSDEEIQERGYDSDMTEAYYGGEC